MAQNKTVVIVVVVILIAFVVWWATRKPSTRRKDINEVEDDISDEYARMVGVAAAAGNRLRQDFDAATSEGFTDFQQEVDNADTYDLSPQPDFVSDANGYMGRNVPAALQNMSDEQIQAEIDAMNEGRRYEDPRGQVPDMPISSNPFGYDIASPNNYKPVNTFGTNYKLKTRNFEINLRGSIAPGEVWTGMFKPRGQGRVLMGGGLLETPENMQRRIEFERARGRQVIRNGNAAEVIM